MSFCLTISSAPYRIYQFYEKQSSNSTSGILSSSRLDWLQYSGLALFRMFHLSCEFIEVGAKRFQQSRVSLCSPFSPCEHSMGIMGGTAGWNSVNSRGPIMYPAYFQPSRRKVGVSLSIPRGISCAGSTMAAVTSFTRTPRSLPRVQWASCRNGGHP